MCAIAASDVDDGFRAGQPHIWISGRDPLLSYVRTTASKADARMLGRSTVAYQCDDRALTMRIGELCDSIPNMERLPHTEQLVA
jgi:hypothetical protein